MLVVQFAAAGPMGLVVADHLDALAERHQRRVDVASLLRG